MKNIFFLTLILAVGFLSYAFLKRGIFDSKDHPSSTDQSSISKSSDDLTPPTALDSTKAKRAGDLASTARENVFLSKEVASTLPQTVKEFLSLEAKVLKSAREKSDREKIMGGKSIYAEVEAMLGETAKPSIEKHLVATSFLEKALFSGNEESQSLALSTIEKVIFEDNIKPTQPAEVQKVLAEDKAELIHYYLTFNPAAQEQVIEKTKSFYKTPTLVQNTIKYHRELATAAKKLSK